MEVILIKSTQPYEKKAIIGTIVFSGVHSILAEGIFGMSPSGEWCFIKTEIGQQVLFYYIIYASLLLIIIIYIRVIVFIVKFRTSAFGKITSRQWKSIRRLSFYPLSFVVIWLPSIIRRLYELNHPFSFGIFVTTLITFPMEGFLNFTAYCITRKLHKLWKHSLWPDVKDLPESLKNEDDEGDDPEGEEAQK